MKKVIIIASIGIFIGTLWQIYDELQEGLPQPNTTVVHRYYQSDQTKADWEEYDGIPAQSSFEEQDYRFEHATKPIVARGITMPSGNAYGIVYKYDKSHFSVPATYPVGQPHYDCKVTVYHAECRQANNGTIFYLWQAKPENIVGEPFDGVVTPHGCFEDETADMVKKALAIDEKK